MTRDQFKILVKAMKAVYPQPTFIPDSDAFVVWYELLKDLDYEKAHIAIQKHMVSEKFPPTIADVRERACEVMNSEQTDMSELQAWSLVYKAICRSTYFAQEEFEKLPIACQIAVGNPANLREWAMMDLSQVQMVEQSHFVRNYRAAVQRIKQEAILTPGIRQYVLADKKEAMLGKNDMQYPAAAGR